MVLRLSMSGVIETKSEFCGLRILLMLLRCIGIQLQDVIQFCGNLSNYWTLGFKGIKNRTQLRRGLEISL